MAKVGGEIMLQNSFIQQPFMECLLPTRAILPVRNTIATNHIATEHLKHGECDWGSQLFNLFNLNLNLRTNTQFSYWKTFKYVYNSLGMQIYFFFNSKVYEMQTQFKYKNLAVFQN